MWNDDRLLVSEATRLTIEQPWLAVRDTLSHVPGRAERQGTVRTRCGRPSRKYMHHSTCQRQVAAWNIHYLIGNATIKRPYRSTVTGEQRKRRRKTHQRSIESREAKKPPHPTRASIYGGKHQRPKESRKTNKIRKMLYRPILCAQLRKRQALFLSPVRVSAHSILLQIPSV